MVRHSKGGVASVGQSQWRSCGLYIYIYTYINHSEGGVSLVLICLHEGVWSQYVSVPVRCGGVCVSPYERGVVSVSCWSSSTLLLIRNWESSIGVWDNISLAGQHAIVTECFQCNWCDSNRNRLVHTGRFRETPQAPISCLKQLLSAGDVLHRFWLRWVE